MAAPRLSRTKQKKMSSSTLIDHYDYHDEAGKLLYQSVRSEPEGFFQRRPDGNGGWIDNVEGVRRVPFHLRSLIADRARNVVYVVEGEKDVLSLHKRGLTATTSAGGAAWKWPDEWAEYFKGATHVVVIAHNDKAGVEAAHQRAGVIARVCHDVRVIDVLPGLPEKGDVSDWLAVEGNTKDRLETLAAKVPKFAPASPSVQPKQETPAAGLPAPRSLQIVKLADVEELPMQWLWDGRIAYNCMTVLAGGGGIGKSFVTMATAAAVTTGGKLPIEGGMQTVEQGNVLLASFEDSAGMVIAQVIKQRARLCGVDQTRLHVIEGARDEKGRVAPFGRPHVDLIGAHLRENPTVRLVIIDPLMSYIGKADVFRDNEVREALGRIVDVVQKCTNEVALLIVHRNREAAGKKGTDKITGSFGLTNLAWSVIAADCEKIYDEKTGEESDGRKMLTVIKGNHFGKTSPIPFGINDDGTFWWSTADTTLLGTNPAQPRKQPTRGNV
jgi:putative DNA primase/helicase